MRWRVVPREVEAHRAVRMKPSRPEPEPEPEPPVPSPEGRDARTGEAGFVY